jgi:hypothetical protein
MDKFQNKVLKLNLDSKRNTNVNSKNNYELKNANNNLIVKNNKKAEVSSKVIRDIKPLTEISVEKLDINENGVSKNQMNQTNSSLFEYIQLSIEALQMQNERTETMINNQSEALDFLDQEKNDLSENYNYFKELIETNSIEVKLQISEIDEKINLIDDEIGDIEKLKNREEKEIFNEISREIKNMVEKTEHEYVY